LLQTNDNNKRRKTMIGSKAKLGASLLFLGLASLTTPVLADKAGDFAVFVGGAYIAPNSSGITTPQSVGAVAAPNGYPSPLNAGFNVINAADTASVQNTEAFVFSALYMVTDHVATELTIGVPPTLKLDLNVPNAAASFPGGAQAKVFFPSLVAKYLFNEPGSFYRPYLTLGVEYSKFSSITVQNSTLLNYMAGGGVTMSSSWNPVFGGGVLFNMDKHWMISAAVDYIPMKSDVTFNSPSSLATVTTTKLTINPINYLLKVGYQF
jgi:outer membrane protein